jgi:hypothetical protein
VQVSDTFFTLETVNDWDERAAPVDWPPLEDPAVGEVAPDEAEPEAELLDPDAELLPLGEALCDPELAPDCVPDTLTSSFTCLLSSESSPVS